MFRQAPHDFDKIIKKLDENDKELAELDAYNNLNEKQIIILCNALKNNTSLIKLNLSGNHIRIEGAKKIAEVIKYNTYLKIIMLESCGLYADKLKSITEALETNTTLSELYLARNEIGSEDAPNIAAVLKVNVTLTILSLAYHEMGAGIQHITNALKTNSSLRALSVSNGSIGVGFSSPMTDLVDTLKQNKTITFLNLSATLLNDREAKILADAITINRSLTTLKLNDNYIGIAGRKYLTDALQLNPILKNLEMTNNSNIYLGNNTSTLFNFRETAEKNERDITLINSLSSSYLG